MWEGVRNERQQLSGRRSACGCGAEGSKGDDGVTEEWGRLFSAMALPFSAQSLNATGLCGWCGGYVARCVFTPGVLGDFMGVKGVMLPL